MLAAVLIDVDFTLAKPRACLEAPGYREVAARYGLTLEEARYAEARAAAALAHRYHPELAHDEEVWVTLTENIVRGMGGSPERSREVAIELSRMWEDCGNFELYEDTTAALDALRGAGLKIGLVSNGSRDLGRFVEHFGLPVDAFLSSRLHGKVKPSPCIFLELLKRLGTTAKEAAMIGDSWVDDVEGARAVGLHAVLLDRHGAHAEKPEAAPNLHAAVERLLRRRSPMSG